MIKKYILVTGSFGFLAQNLIKNLLKSRYNVLGIDKKKQTVFCYNFSKYIKEKKLINKEIDIRNKKKLYIFLKKYEISACFHLAAITQVNDSDKFPLVNFETNIMSTIFLLEYFRKFSDKSIFYIFIK